MREACEQVQTYLNRMETRDLDGARAMLAEGFVMQFPGAPEMHTLSELINWAAPRYQFVKKTYLGFDACTGGSEVTIVYCRGVLSGQWPDGSAFDGIRFIDRFELVGGKITRQDVWNDIGEVRNGS